MLHLVRTRRPRRAGEWTEAKAVTFIVTLAASRSVTLAAARAGMSRKAAYALKHRDPRFAAAWQTALAAATSSRREEPALNSIQGDKVDEVDGNRIRRAEGNRSERPGDVTLARNRPGAGFENLWNSTIESACSSLARQVSLP